VESRFLKDIKVEQRLFGKRKGTGGGRKERLMGAEYDQSMLYTL
jgi:hypothetical protein